MSGEIVNELIEFLKSSALSNYEINAFTALLNSNALTAKEISKISRVPTGRIYEILEKLCEFGMIEIQESRPKMYRSLSLNLAFHNLISHLSKENQRKISYLFDRAKVIETKLYESNFIVKKLPPSHVFLSVYNKLALSQVRLISR